MTPQNLLKKTIQAEASKDSSDFEDVLHRTIVRKAKVEYGDFRKVTKSDLEDRDIQDEISFLNMQTSSFLEKGDVLTYNEIEYSVEYFTPVVTGVFNIFATKKIRTGSM